MSDPAAIADLVWHEAAVADPQTDEPTLWLCLARGRQMAQGKRGDAWAAVERAAANRIAEANLGLVYLVCGQLSGRGDHDQILSDCMFAFHRAIRGFDPSRGFKFSTYACNAMFRSAGRDSAKAARLAARRLPLPAWTDPPTDRPDDNLLGVQEVRQLMRELPPVDRQILRQRYGMGCRRRTLRAIGDSMGVSKERVRQMQVHAEKNLRKLAKRAINQAT